MREYGWSARAARLPSPASSGRWPCAPGWPSRPAASPRIPSWQPGPARRRRPGVRRSRHRHEPAGQEGRAAGGRRRAAGPAGRRAGPELAAVEANLRPVPGRATQGETAAAVAADLTEFAARHRLDQVVADQRRVTPSRCRDRTRRTPAWPRWQPRWPGTGRCCRRARSYAVRGLPRRLPYVDFTPSTGARLPALAELARRARPAVRGARRQDRRDAGQVGAGPDVRAAQPAGAQPGPGSTCSAAATGRTSPNRPPTPQDRQQAAGARRDARLPAARARTRIDLRRRPRRLQDGLGPGHLLPVSSAPRCGWSSPGTAATRRSPRRSCSTWLDSPPPRTRAGRCGPCPSWPSSSRIRSGRARTRCPTSGRRPASMSRRAALGAATE